MLSSLLCLLCACQVPQHDCSHYWRFQATVGEEMSPIHFSEEFLQADSRTPPHEPHILMRTISRMDVS